MTRMSYQISTEQARQTGDILGIAIVERLDLIVGLLKEIKRGDAAPPPDGHPTPGELNPA